MFQGNSNIFHRNNKAHHVHTAACALERNWKELRKLAYSFKEFNDVNLPYVYNSYTGDELVDQIVMFFESGSQLIYPAKSYFTAMVYASLLDYFGLAEYSTALTDPELLPDDKFFVPYGGSDVVSYVYDKVLSVLKLRYGLNITSAVKREHGRAAAPLPCFALHLFPSAEVTREYFLDEFLIPDEERKKYYQDYAHVGVFAWETANHA